VSRRGLHFLNAPCHEDRGNEEEQDYQTGLHYGENGTGKTLKIGMPVWLKGFNTNTFSLLMWQGEKMEGENR
jgi:hypothetical protein